MLSCYRVLSCSDFIFSYRVIVLSCLIVFWPFDIYFDYRDIMFSVLHESIPKQNPHGAFPIHDPHETILRSTLYEAILLSCYRAIVLLCYCSFMKQCPNKTIMHQFQIENILKQSGYFVIVCIALS